jgi:hypothetical protein
MATANVLLIEAGRFGIHLDDPRPAFPIYTYVDRQNG